MVLLLSIIAGKAAGWRGVGSERRDAKGATSSFAMSAALSSAMLSGFCFSSATPNPFKGEGVNAADIEVASDVVISDSVAANGSVIGAGSPERSGGALGAISVPATSSIV